MSNPCSYVLSGQDGSVWLKPAGTSVCLNDFSSFVETSGILVPVTHDFRVGDPVMFRVGKGLPTLDSAYDYGETYYVAVVDSDIYMGKTINYVVLATTPNLSTIINPVGDGGIQDQNTQDGHLVMEYAQYLAVSEVKNFMITITRDKIDTTSIAEGVKGFGQFAEFRTQQTGYAAGTGNLTVMFGRDQKNLVSRLQEGVLLKVQDGASVKLYVDTVFDESILETAPNDLESSYFDAPITIESFEAKVDPQNATEGTITFSISDPPDQILSVSGPPSIFSVTPFALV
jgi:hypothetical protein